MNTTERNTMADECGRMFEAVTMTDLFKAAALDLALSRVASFDTAVTHGEYYTALADVVNHATAHALAAIKSHTES